MDDLLILEKLPITGNKMPQVIIVSQLTVMKESKGKCISECLQIVYRSLSFCL